MSADALASRLQASLNFAQEAPCEPRAVRGMDVVSITIRTQGGNDFSVYVDKIQTVDSLRRELILNHLPSASSSAQKVQLFCGGSLMEPHRTLGDCGVASGSKVFVRQG